MTYVVTDISMHRTYTDGVAVCPVDCCSVGETKLVINPAEWIDCGAGEPECPGDAIKADTEPGLAAWLALDPKRSALWADIAEKREFLGDVADCNGRTRRLEAAFGVAHAA